jgi:hypothetical protein
MNPEYGADNFNFNCNYKFEAKTRRQLGIVDGPVVGAVVDKRAKQVSDDTVYYALDLAVV